MENNNNYEIKQSATIRRILKSSNYFEVLDVERNATKDQIKKSFRELSKMVHPDKCSHPNSTQAFRQLQKASETLLDETKKSEYIKTLITVKELVLRQWR
jgi:curved DNA-binding protein CbpA